MPLTALVLAAGFSRRFGAPKQLHLIDGEPMVRRAARLARDVAPTVVVIPANDPAIRDALRGLDVLIVENGEAEEGMASSIRAALRVCDGDLLITLGDQPHVTAAHLRALATAGAPLAATAYDGTIGVPAYFAARFRDELLLLRGDRGAKRVLEAHREEVVTIPLAAAEHDVDEANATQGA